MLESLASISPPTAPAGVAFVPAVVTPTYNNAATLSDILARVRRLGLPVIVVNDGSTDATDSILRSLVAGGDDIRVITHPHNRGKAAALATGFAAAQDAGFTHCVTIDTDGQLDPEQIPELLEVARTNPKALIIGVRDDGKADYPARSRLGRRISNLMIRMESGLRVNDSQCGLRIYPVSFAREITCFCGRFCYETEIITRAGWSGCPVREVPVNCVYLPPGQRVSHFRPVIDTFRSIAMHLVLVGRALLPFPHKHWSQAAPHHVDPKATLRDILSWLSPAEFMRLLRDESIGQNSLATGLAIGVFIACTPFYGLQNLIGLYFARRLHLHPLPVLLGAQISNPPMSFGLIAAAVCCGHFVLHGRLPALGDYHLHQTLGELSRYEWTQAYHAMQGTLGSFLLDWAIGSVIVGLTGGTLAFFIGHYAFTHLTKRRRHPPQSPQV